MSEPHFVVKAEGLRQLTLEERIAWAICMAPHEATRSWAVAWLSGADRSEGAAHAAAHAAYRVEENMRWDSRPAPERDAERAKARAAAITALAALNAAIATRMHRMARDMDMRQPASLSAHRASEYWVAAEVRVADAISRAASVVDSRAQSAALSRARAILAGEMPAEEYGG